MSKLTDFKNQFNVYLIRKKIIILIKVITIITLFTYILVTHFFNNSVLGDLIFYIFIIILAIALDVILNKVITKPIKHINDIASKMSKLDFSENCFVGTKDEFNTLSNNLNIMSKNLQNALKQQKELSDILSHELKTPLGIIHAYTEGIRDKTNLHKTDEYIDVILDESEKMSIIINSILDLSALESGVIQLNLKKIEFVEFVETIAGRLFIDNSEENLTFSYNLPNVPIYVLVDKERIEQVLNNFISNAKKFVCEKGNIHLSLSIEKACVRFSIYNDGNKIIEEELSNIWNKFYRSKSITNIKGSGLGLAISSQILTMHKSEFGVKNIKKGVEFYFFLEISNNYALSRDTVKFDQ